MQNENKNLHKLSYQRLPKALRGIYVRLQGGHHITTWRHVCPVAMLGIGNYKIGDCWGHYNVQHPGLAQLYA